MKKGGTRREGGRQAGGERGREGEKEGGRKVRRKEGREETSEQAKKNGQGTGGEVCVTFINAMTTVSSSTAHRPASIKCIITGEGFIALKGYQHACMTVRRVAPRFLICTPKLNRFKFRSTHTLGMGAEQWKP